MVQRWELVGFTGGAQVDEVLNRLLGLAFTFHADHGRVDHLSADALELAVVAKVDLDILVLGEQFANQLEHAQQRLVEGALLSGGLLGHSREVRLNQGVELHLGL